MNVNLVVAPNSSHLSRIQAALSLVNGCQRFFRLMLIENAIVANQHPVNAANLCAEWKRNDGVNSRSILITEALLDDNWFSHEYRDCALITIGDWERHYAPPSLRSYIIYQIVQALIHFSADLSEEMALQMVHDPPIGCVYDMASHKPDIKFGMVAGNFCPNCLARLRSLGTNQDAIDALINILEVVRNEAFGIPISLDPNEVFVVMRFSANDENDNAWKYGIKLGIERYGLAAMRANNRVESGQLLEKVHRYIARSRLVIAKVDQDNLNVYFELGLAMGMKKDVLLVSDESLVLSLPSDLKNWECLTYKTGDYEQLANNVFQFLTSAYGSLVFNGIR